MMLWNFGSRIGSDCSPWVILVAVIDRAGRGDA
jgi:hypothetical protein